MARTKKQTIDAASARKRQIQEEILNESLALYGKGENTKSSSCEATNKKSGSVTSTSCKTADSSRESSLTRSSTDSSAISISSSENSVDFPKAVIRITDIYKSSPELLDATCVKVSKSFSSPKSHGSYSVKPGYEKDLKQDICESMDMYNDMKTLSSSCSSKQKSSSAANSDGSPKKNGKSPPSKIHGTEHGRRSPRRQQQASPESPHALSSSLESYSPPKLGRPKINIFTDNLGVDLGKRVRSPRRLSEDMIALPIYSMRRAGSSPKENFGPLRNQDSENSVENSQKRLPPRGSPSTSYCDERQFNHTLSFLEPDLSSIPTKELSLKKSKFQALSGRSMAISDLISDQEISKSNAISFEENSNCDKREKSSFDAKGKPNVELLMSSICKDIIGEVTSESSYLFQRVQKRSDYSDQNFENENKEGRGGSAETLLKCEKVAMNIDVPNSQANKKLKSEENVQLLSSGTISNSKEHPSSLLCAMLVGGTDVAQNYSQKKEKLKPETSEVSDTESVQFSEVGLRVTGDQNKDTQGESLCCGTDTGLISSGNTDFLEDETPQSNENHLCEESTETDMKDADYKEILSEDIKGNKAVDKLLDAKPDIKESVVNESHVHGEAPTSSCNKDAREDSSDSSGTGKDETDQKAWRKMKINFSSQLRHLNEKILKLLAIDVEDEFMTLPDKSDNEAHTESDTETKLYGLIHSLSHRLKDDISKCSVSTESDVDNIDQLLQSCPKSHQRITSSSGNAVWNKILGRLNEEESKSEKNEIPSTSVSDNCCTETPAAIVNSSSVMTSNKTDSQDVKTVKLMGNSKWEEKNMSSVTLSTGDQSTPALHSNSSSSLNGSLCDIDVDAITSAATSALKIPGSDLDKPPPSSNAVSSKCESESKREDQLKPVTDIPAKPPFHKALTCSDFTASSDTKVLRRVSSSPQLLKNASSPLPSSLIAATSFEEGESTIKSKLGSKIPIPRSVVVPKSCKKSWRTPRIIMNPKPLNILQQLEKYSPKKDIFVSSELQKYLWMPSSRMIVSSAIREEIKRADETAKQAWEAKMILIKEDDDCNKKKDDEEVNKQFSKHEPDFDEVEGMLFMSFTSEVELNAHIHVEKALEWDKDDTMLRISRAKVFEETKAMKGDMKEVKMKHLRGQHMRWKKYKRMFSKEVNTLLEAKKKGIPLDQIKNMRKTSDVTKIKGWKNKPGLVKVFPTQTKDVSAVCDTKMKIFSHCEQPEPSSMDSFKSNQEPVDKDIKRALDERKRDLSPKSRRQFNFSDRKVHRQLFKELKMDWEDRMIHRKLGGWSLKGNRPKAFSRAAIKRQKQEMKDTSPEGSSDVVSDINMTESGTDISPNSGGNLISRRRKLVYPLLTEKLARNCLKTLETGDIIKALRRKKKKRLRQEALSHLPALTPMPIAVSSELSISQALTSPSGSSVKEEWSASQTPLTSTPSVTTPLNLDMLDDPVLEGVDVTSRISSPSVTDVGNSPQVKGCGKLGCRYGCICHLCSANESPVPSESSLLKPSTPACDKEYCRLGCICDSLDPEQSTPSQAHCGKPSCMLECVCSDSGLTSGQVDGSDDIPLLPSMKQRPKIGERFSNLPRREKTHRSAKNLDAVTRKAMMLYETSEIYCEKVERAKKRESSSDSPKSLIKTGSPSEVNTSSDCILIEEDDIVTTAQSTKKETPALVPDIEVPDILLSVPVMEPNAHKRKRKSHPLSSEIFSFSSCARIQPYVSRRSKVQKLLSDRHGHTVASSMLLIAGPSQLNSKEEKIDSLPQTASVSHSNVSDGLGDLKICNVTSLAAQARKYQQATNGNGKDLAKQGGHSEVVVRPPAGLIPLSKIQESGKRAKLAHQDLAAEHKPHHGWHTSMVCLKAKAPSKSEVESEDDVQEEDEVKLLEFAADCQWDGSKRAILAQVASCLTRGHYPQPRTMNIGEFVVEILPKAQYPTVIPPELRAKLPDQMYSIRVRITRRHGPPKVKLLSPSAVSEPLIDLSMPSPPKDQLSIPVFSPPSSSLTHTESSTPLSSPSCDIMSTSSSQFSTTSSHIGISGLSQVCVTSSSKRQHGLSTKSSSAPGSRRSSVETSKFDSSLSSADDTSVSMAPINLKSPIPFPSLPDTKNTSANAPMVCLSSPEIKSPTNLSSVKLRAQSPSAAATASATSPKILSPMVQPFKLFSTSSSLLKRTNMVVSSSKCRPIQPLIPLAKNAPNPLLKAVNPKDLKYVQLPNKEPLMVYEVDVKTDKKTLIAVPLSLAGKTSDIKGKPILTVPVPSVGHQKVLPLLASRPKATDESSPQFIKMKKSCPTSQSLLVKIPPINPSVIVPSEQLSKSRGLLHLVPVSVQNTSLRHVNISKPISTSSKQAKQSGHSGDSEMCEIKIGNASKLNIPHTVVDLKTCKEQDPLFPSTTVTQSRERPIPSSEISPVKKQFPDTNTTVPKSAFCSTKTIVSSNETGNSQENNVLKNKSCSELGSEGSEADPIIMENSSEESYDSRHEKVKDVNDTKGIVIMEPNLQNNISKSQDLQESKAPAKTSLSKSLLPVVVSSTSKQITHSASKESERNSQSFIAASSFFPLGPINDNESFNGFSVMKDISYPGLSSGDPTSIGFEPIGPSTLDPAVETHDSGLKSETGRNNETLITISSSKQGTHNPLSVTVDLDLKRSGAHIQKTSSQSSSQDLKEMPSASSNLKRGVQDLGMKDDSAPETKRLRPLDDGLPLGEDDINIPNNPSPHSSCSRPKSGLSSVLSSGSSEDLIVPLSSDEEIDVGENAPADAFSSFQEQVERAWENDHSSMYCKPVKSNTSAQNELQPPPPPPPAAKVKAPVSKGRFHKYLERARRAKLKELFDQLAEIIRSIQAFKINFQKGADASLMPRATVLDYARKTILHLNEVLRSGETEISQLTMKNESLKRELRTVKAELLRRNVSGRAIAAIVNRISRQAKKKQEMIASQPRGDATDEVDGACSQSDDLVNLVSPSSSDGGNGDEDVSVPESESFEESAHDNGKGASSKGRGVSVEPVPPKHEDMKEESAALKSKVDGAVSTLQGAPDEGVSSKNGVAREETSFPKYEDISQDNVIDYKDVSNIEGGVCTKQEPAGQYEDITDEECGS